MSSCIATQSGKCKLDEEVEIYYELYGEGAEKVLMVMGLGTSAMAWLANVSFFFFLLLP